MTVANKLTFIRFALAFLFVLLHYIFWCEAILPMTIIFIIAAITDFLDGYIARKYNQVTKLGKLIDPLADKVLVFSALLLFVEMSIIPAWPVIIILSRDLMIGIFRAIAIGEGVVIAADIYGKAKTVVQLISIIVLLVSMSFGNIFVDFCISLLAIGKILIYVATILTVISGVKYVKDNIDILK
ncbi:MAG: CDP-diacylglycerol--glycerol-3-phosphate 3-phosphatidyltransferase [Clostridiales bacterium]|nr:MAG: CDP-diacylglycerol--glycerol-3-phosphate 3-phosphatidyltransferase [Clostridiales bacterium]